MVGCEAFEVVEVFFGVPWNGVLKADSLGGGYCGDNPDLHFV